MRRTIALLLTTLVVVAGGTPAVDAATAVPADDGSASLDTSDGDGSAPQLDDPPEDVIGWEAGYWHNESIDVNQSDGLSDEELDAYVSRAMARVEYIREREFEEDVPVDVVSREAYRQQANNQSAANASYAAWNNQVWEALFVVGEGTDVQRELGTTLGTSVAGFYSPADDEIKIVSPSADSPTIDNATLIHELTHAVQDQYHNLSAAKYRGATQDGDLASDGIVEGEANYIEDRYRQRCEAGEWECVATPIGEAGDGNGSQPNLGIYLTLLQPYSDGPAYVHGLYEAGGWDAVDRKMTHPPNSTEQTIHVTSEAPTPIAYEHDATGGWEPYPALGENGSDTVGEASLYAMAYYQDRRHDLPGVDYRNVANAAGEYDTYNYTTQATAGWANDRVFPYHEGSGNDSRHGYVWVTEWDTKRDAAEFASFYESVLNANGAERRANGTYVVNEGPFADAFRLRHDGTRVTIVNGPTPASLGEIRPGFEASTGADGDDADDADGTTAPADTAEATTDGSPGGDTASGTTGATDTNATGTDSGETTDATSPGFGGVVALLALAAGALLFGRRRGR